MDGKFTFDLADLVIRLIEQYGAAGFAMSFGVYYVVILQKKIDKLINLNYKMFGALTAFASKSKKSKRGIEDDD